MSLCLLAARRWRAGGSVEDLDLKARWCLGIFDQQERVLFNLFRSQASHRPNVRANPVH